MLRFFSESENLNFWQILKKNLAFTLKKKSTVLDGFFPYLAQMITSMRGCVAYNDLWPWPISSRSFGLGLENHVRSVASTVLDGFFPYLTQMITSMRRCVACVSVKPCQAAYAGKVSMIKATCIWLSLVGSLWCRTLHLTGKNQINMKQIFLQSTVQICMFDDDAFQWAKPIIILLWHFGRPCTEN